MSNESNYKKISEIISNEYLIKNYQRGYRWDILQIKNLLDDIYGNFKRYYFQYNNDDKKKYNDNKKDDMNEDHLLNATVRKKIGTQYAYCLQPLVVKKDSETERYSVIDGQQRLTTISLIINALKKLHDSPDKVSINYESESKSKSISIDEICNICDENTDFAKVLEKHSETDFNDLENICDSCLENIYKALPNIDAKFMARGYVYIRLYYKTIINQVKKYADEGKKAHKQDHLYFVYPEFEDSDFDENTVYTEIVPDLLRNVIKYCTTVIWYEPLKDKNKDKTEEDIFKNFNSGKIPLTKSELVKALLMNPDNYTKDSDNNISSEAIKTRQILIASKWDEMEKKLHDEELWHFFPHYDAWHDRTRFDALIDYFVYCEYMDRGKNSDDYKALQNDKEKEKLFLNKIDLAFQNHMKNDNEHYTYNLLEKFIKEDLLKAESSDDKTEKMKKWWKKICDTYSSFEVYISNDKKIIEQFHRISLVKWMDEKYFKNVTNKGNEEHYLKQILSQNYKIFAELASKRNSEKKSVLNKLINQRIQKIFESSNTVTFSAKDENGNKIKIENNHTVCNNLSKKIRALVYSPGYEILVETFLKIFTLDIMENNKSALTRYPFFSDKEEKWEREHIFAKNTDFTDYKNKTSEEKKQLINDIIGKAVDTNFGWEEYLRFKYEDLLEASEIDSIINQKQKMIDCLEECLEYIEKNPDKTEKIDYIFDESIKDLTADSGAPIEFSDKDENPFWNPNLTIVQFLRDNSMGNMCMLPKGINDSVGCKPYHKKKEIVLKCLYEDGFIPMSTLMVFSGAYCAKYSTEYWYPCHRKKYLEAMIKGVENYLE